MKEILENSGWEHYMTGCSCAGLPRYFRNDDRPETIIILKGQTFTIKSGGVVKFKGIKEEFELKMKEYELI